jgi:hypothetical protein
MNEPPYRCLVEIPVSHSQRVTVVGCPTTDHPTLGYWEAPTSLAGRRPVRAARNRSPAMLTSLSRESGGTAGSVGCPCLGHALFHRIGGRTQT